MASAFLILAVFCSALAYMYGATKAKLDIEIKDKKPEKKEEPVPVYNVSPMNR